MIKIGIIGCGRIVEVAHAGAFAKLRKLFQVTALADPSPERLKLVSNMLKKARLPEPTVYQDYRKMLEAEKLDAVDMALPHFLHHQAVMDVVAAKVNIFTEKPLAVNTKQAEQMIAACKQARLALVIFHNYLYIPQFAKAIELVQAGAIGKPFLMRSEGVGGGHWPGTPSYDPDWRTKASLAGGGCLLDNGYHNLYLARAFMQDDVNQVYASINTYSQKINVDDTAAVMLRHKRGGTSTILVAWSIPASGVTAQEIHGTEGSISFTLAKPGAPEGDTLALHCNKTGKWTWPSFSKMEGDSFVGILREWGTKVDTWIANGRRGTAPANTPEALRNLQIIDAAYESSKTGKAVNV